MIWLAVGGLLLLALFGAPLFAVVLGAAMLGFITVDVDLSVLAIEIYRIADTPLLIALPLFAYTGYVLAAGNTSERLVNLTRAFFGWVPAGLAVVSFVACAIFTALTGASGVTIVALGALLLPALVSDGYGERFSLGLVTSSGSLGLLLAPSVPLILYGIVAQQLELGEPFTLQALFLAGIGPALLMLLLLSAYAVSQRGFRADSRRFSRREVLGALWAARWEIPLPFAVLGSIYSGWVAVSEAAAVAAVYVTLVACLFYRELRLRDLAGVVRESMVMVGGILLILASALAFTNYLVDAEIPQHLLEWVQARVDSKLAFLVVVNVVLLLLGAILDIFAALVIVVPLLLPLAIAYDVHPIHFGIIFLANMQIGYFTPPIGMNLFIASYRFNRSVTDLYHACLPFMLVLLVALVIITYVPALSLFMVE